MSSKTSLLSRAALCSFLVVPAAFAQSVVQGDVKGVDGRALKGARVQLERQDKKAAPIVVTTDFKGRFTANNIPDGKYAVSAATSAGVRSPVQTVQARMDRPVMITFDLRPTHGSKTAAGGKKKKKYVWVPSETGSHLGGKYVEVDEDATDAGPSADHISKSSGAEVKRLQSTQGMSNSMGGGSGH
jgi:hypothetical protein